MYKLDAMDCGIRSCLCGYGSYDFIRQKKGSRQPAPLATAGWTPRVECCVHMVRLFMMREMSYDFLRQKKGSPQPMRTRRKGWTPHV